MNMIRGKEIIFYIYIFFKAIQSTVEFVSVTFPLFIDFYRFLRALYRVLLSFPASIVNVTKMALTSRIANPKLLLLRKRSRKKYVVVVCRC